MTWNLFLLSQFITKKWAQSIARRWQRRSEPRGAQAGVPQAECQHLSSPQLTQAARFVLWVPVDSTASSPPKSALARLFGPTDLRMSAFWTDGFKMALNNLNKPVILVTDLRL